MTQEQDIKNAVEVLRRGGIILYPTDTIWGIGCDATNEDAVRRVYEIKQRDDSKSLICLVDSDARLQRYVRNVPDVAWQLIDCLSDNGQHSTVNGQRSMVNGQRSMVNGQRSMANGQRSMVNGQRSMVNGQWSMVCAYCPVGG